MRKKPPFEMTFCCAEKAFKLLAQKCDKTWRKVWRCFVGKGTRHPKPTDSVTFLPPNCHFLPPKRPVENRDFVDFCAKLFAFVFENGR